MIIADKVAAVVVTFNPDDNILDNLRAISSNIEKVYVIDNNSKNREWFKDIPNNCTLIQQKKNIGLAGALNSGVRAARRDGFEWAVTFDQDSTMPPEYLTTILENAKYIDTTYVGIISCLYVDRETGYKKSFADRKLGCLNNDFCHARVTMTSGSLTNLRALEQCGDFNDAMFIDQLDNEICLKLRQNSYSVLENQNVILLHGVGKSTEKKLVGLILRPSNHSALRRYYMMRNRTYLYKRYYRFDPVWLAEDIFAALKEHFKLVIYEEEATKKIGMSLKGLNDGLRGRMGEYDTK